MLDAARRPVGAGGCHRSRLAEIVAAAVKGGCQRPPGCPGEGSAHKKPAQLAHFFGCGGGIWNLRPPSHEPGGAFASQPARFRGCGSSYESQRTSNPYRACADSSLKAIENALQGDSALQFVSMLQTLT
jgi:hypothetical protein